MQTHRGATIDDIRDRVKPILRRSPDKVILHCGTNYLCSNLQPEEIANNVVNFGLSLNLPGDSLVVSGIVPRGDELKGKAAKVNTELVLQCQKRNMAFVFHDIVNPQLHLY